MRSEIIVVEKTLPNERLDTFLRQKFPAASRSAIQRLIEEKNVLVNGRAVKPTHRPVAGEKIELRWPEPRVAEAQPEDIPLDVLFEDKHLLVLNKPAGSVVHPAAGHEEHTLVNALLHHCAGQLSGIGGVMRPGIIHRLDKDTSGCLVVAKHDEAHVALSAQFASRKVEKIYHAIVCGELPRDKGEIRADIARHPTHRKRMAVSERGREARTTFKILERLNCATLAEVVLHTGRTHQVRVHFQHIGFPIVGDDTYGSRQNRKLEGMTRYKAPRQMLHAFRLAFIHPHSGKRVSFEAPWPEDFKDAVTALK